MSAHAAAHTDPARTRRHAIDPAIVAWMRLARIARRIDQRTTDTLRPINLNVSRFDVLNHAGAGEARTQQELTDLLLVTKGNICQMIDALERKGLLQRRRDGRSKRIYLTNQGRALRERALALQETQLLDAFSELSPEERTTLNALLRKLDHTLD